MTLNDNRNFRLLYYEHLGLHNVEQKKALDQLLSEDPINTDKLKIFSEEFVLPATLRPFVWKVLLHILPVHQESMEFVKTQREGQYEDSRQALATMRLLTDKVHETIKTMYLLERGTLSVMHRDVPENEPSKVRVLESMCQVVSEMIADPCDAYWITRCMFDNQSAFEPVFAKLPKYVKYYLHLEDKRLFEHLCEIQMFKILRYDRWFQTYFTPVFADSLQHVHKIWDKLVAGSCNILVFVFVALLLTFSIQLKEMRCADVALELISSVPRSSVHVVVDKTLELWDQYRKALAVELGTH